MSASAANRPTATPASVTRAACRTTIRRTRAASAPNAMRTAISRVRRDTTYERTPYSPTAPRIKASPDAMASMSIVKESCAIERAASPSMVKILYIGDSGTTSRMRLRISGASNSARVDFTTYAGDPTAQLRGWGPTIGR